MERLTRNFARELAHVIGPEKDVPAPDVGSTAKMMHWIADEYSKHVGEHSPSVVTGKPVEHGGSEGRTEATGYGGGYVLELFLRKANGGVYETPHMTVAIQGFGNVGSYLAQYLERQGFKIIGLSDSKSGIHMPNGIDVKAAEKYKKEKGSLIGFGLTGQGGVVVSYFEWEQNRRGEQWQKTDVLTKLKEMMESAAEKVWAESQTKNITLRDGAYSVALRNLESNS